jgi:HEPN domain-containing protein
MHAVDDFAFSLLEEAKRFLERAKRECRLGHPILHAALLLALCSLEAHVNAAADNFAKRQELSLHEIGVLLERDVHLVNGQFQMTEKLRNSRLEDRIDLLHQKISIAVGLQKSEMAI